MKITVDHNSSAGSYRSGSYRRSKSAMSVSNKRSELSVSRKDKDDIYDESDSFEDEIEDFDNDEDKDDVQPLTLNEINPLIFRQTSKLSR